MASALMVDGELPTFEVVDEHTVRYTWKSGNPYFLPAIAGPNPLYLYKPAHYLQQFHKKYVGEDEMAKMVADSGKRNWMAVHHGKDRPYKQSNPDLPTPYLVHLWSTAKGAQLALYPNFNANDPQYRELMRNADFRRALSMAINRKQINKVVYFGLATPSNNTVVRESSLYKPEYAETWTQFDIDAANKLLDGIGLTERDGRGIRKLPDGRPLEIPVQTAGESTEQTDVLELVHDSWMKVGVKLFSVPSQREVFRNRVFSGEAVMAIWGGLENGLPSASSIPRWIAPTTKYQYQWPKWGEYVESDGKAGEEPDLPEAQELVQLYKDWRMAGSEADRETIWHKMLAINTDQLFTIGIVNGVKQPVVVNKYLNNVPEKGIYDISVTAYFGAYQPDTFWFSKERQ